MKKMNCFLFIVNLFFLLNLCIELNAQSTLLKIQDTRFVKDRPNFTQSSIRADMKLDTIIGIPIREFSTNLTISPWHDDSAGFVHQLNFNNGGISYRNGRYTGTWTPWSKLLLVDYSNNIQSNLGINGTLRAKEVIVTVSGWADFVFKKNYQLPTLEEVEQHIKENGHLLNIPSEAEIEINGISLGEINSKLLQKIEELTLYVIQLQKEVNELKLQVK